MKVSVLLISYNHEDYIEKAIQSILMQKETDEFEIIFSDDYSSDNTFAIGKELLQSRGNVKIIYNEKNYGITRNYQRSFKLCEGEYIFVLEADDYWTDPFKIKKVTEFLDDHPSVVMCGHPFVIERPEKKIFELPILKAQKTHDFFDTKDLILDSSLINNFSTCCYRRSALQKISPKTYEVVSYDWMINISVTQFGLAARLNEPMSVYKIASTSSWWKMSELEQLKAIESILPEYDKILDHKYHEYFEQKKEMIRGQLRNLEKPAGKKTGLKDFIPPVFVQLIRLFLPPAIFNQIKSRFQ